MLKRILELLKDSLTYGVGSVLEKLIGFVLIPVYTRYLLPADYGIMAMLAILAVTFEVLAFIGMKSSIFREFSLADDASFRRQVVTNGLVSILVTSILLAGLGSLCAGFISKVLLGTTEHAAFVRVSLLTCALTSISMVPILVMQAARQAQLVTTLNFAKLLFTVGTTLVLVVALRWGVWGTIVAQAISAAVFVGPQLWILLRQYPLSFDRPLLVRMLKYGVPFLPYRIQVVGVSAFAEYSVRSMLGLNEAGLYNIATRFALPLGFIVQAINQAWWPYKFHIFKQEKNPGAVFRSITTYYFATMNYLWVGVAVWGPEVLKWLTPPQYHGAAILVPILALQRLLMGVYQIMSTGIELSDSAREVGLIGLAGLVAGVTSAYALIPYFHAPGAAIAAAFAQLVMTGAAYVLAQKRFRIEYDWGPIAAFSALALTCVTTEYWTLSWQQPSRIAFALLVSVLYPAIALAVLARSEQERQRLRSGARRLLGRFRRTAT